MIVMKMRLTPLLTVIMVIILNTTVHWTEGASISKGRKMKVSLQPSQRMNFHEIQTTANEESILEDELLEEDFEVPPPPEYAEDEEMEEDDQGSFTGLGRRGEAGKSRIRPWPNAQIPYVIWGSSKTKKKVLSALAKIESKTCLRFLPRSSEARYVVIKEDDGGCWTSSTGYPSYDKKVIVGLGLGCRGPGRIIHEVLHASGFLHEHVRPDRGNYIVINWDNIKKDGRWNFKTDYRYQPLSIPYDYKSIMHYGRHAFAKVKSEPTIEPTTAVTGKLGGSSLTQYDIQRINTFYQC